VFSRKSSSVRTDGRSVRSSYGIAVELQLPVIWSLHGTTSPGRLDVSRGRLALTSRERAFSFPLGSVATFMIERAACAVCPYSRFGSSAARRSRSPAWAAPAHFRIWLP
jgi:hypothetical protein